MKPYASKTGEKAGVIDLGTNTFHLMIAPLGGKLDKSQITRLRRHVRLGESSNRFLGPKAMDRALRVMKEFEVLLKSEGISRVKAVGTAMLRNASNTEEFKGRVLKEVGIEIEVISGLEEARLIFAGVKLSNSLSEKTSLLMDIGGGSVEFILADGGKMSKLWSFDVGVSFMKNEFHKNEPMSSSERSHLENHLLSTMQPMLDFIREYSSLRLIGISGTFDLIHDHFSNSAPKGTALFQPSEIASFGEQIIPLSLFDRLNHPSIPESRADLIPAALVLVNLILAICPIKEVIVSPYSIKEGVLTTLV